MKPKKKPDLDAASAEAGASRGAVRYPLAALAPVAVQWVVYAGAYAAGALAAVTRPDPSVPWGGYVSLLYAGLQVFGAFAPALAYLGVRASQRARGEVPPGPTRWLVEFAGTLALSWVSLRLSFWLLRHVG